MDKRLMQAKISIVVYANSMSNLDSKVLKRFSVDTIQGPHAESFLRVVHILWDRTTAVVKV